MAESGTRGGWAMWCARRWLARARGVPRPLRRATPAVVVGLVAVIATMGVPSRSSAVTPGLHVGLNPGQVRIFENGEFLGSGTLVDPQWVLTVTHLFDRPDNPGIHSLRFGELTGGSTDVTNLRIVDQIVLHPSGADLAMIHFANPVTSGTVIPALAAQAPPRYSAINLYGWGPDGSVLQRAPGLVIDPAASVNADWGREHLPQFNVAFPQSNPPLVVNLGDSAEEGDSGAGVYTRAGTVAGVLVGSFDYRWTNESGDLYGQEFFAAYDQPVWSYADWIRRTINGAGTSGTIHDELKRRRLDEVTPGATSPMTPPPAMATCDPGDPNCTTPAPVWEPAQLTGTTQQKSVVPTRCWDQQGNSCFMLASYAGGATAQLSLDAMTSTGSRDIVVWCRLPDPGNPAQSAVLYSFANADKADGPLGTGWWVASSSNVTSNGAVLDVTRLSTCPG